MPSKNTTSAAPKYEGCTPEDRARVMANGLMGRWSVPGSAPVVVGSSPDDDREADLQYAISGRRDRPRPTKNLGKQPGLKTFAQTGGVNENTVSEAGRLVATIELGIEDARMGHQEQINSYQRQIEEENERHGRRIAELQNSILKMENAEQKTVASHEDDLDKAIMVRETLASILDEQS
jgi:hypothetical protein